MSDYIGPDWGNMTSQELRDYEDALERLIAERRLAAEIESAMTVTCMRCFGKGRVPIPKESDPDENGIVRFDGTFEGLLESIQAQHTDIQPGQVSDESAVKLVKGSGVFGAIIAMHNNGFDGEQTRDVLARSGLSEAEIEAELDEIQRRADEDDELDGHPDQDSPA